MLKSERKLIDWMIKRKDILLFLIVTCMAILARIPGLDYISEDMTDHLLPWAEQFRANPGFSAMRSQIGDYNILYQTLIVLICRLPGSMVYLYKYISIFCDFLLAVICGELVRKVKGGTAFCPAFAVTYAIVLFVPTVILNSAVWGQCDAMYTCVCILALAALYRRRYVASFIALGIAFALKLQTIFILPVYLYVYICRRDFSLLHFFISIFTLWVTGIPAYLEGRSLLTVFQIYLNQVNEYPQLVMNSPSIWTLFFPGYAYMRLCALITTVLILGFSCITCSITSKSSAKTRKAILFSLRGAPGRVSSSFPPCMNATPICQTFCWCFWRFSPANIYPMPSSPCVYPELPTPTICRIIRYGGLSPILHPLPQALGLHSHSAFFQLP